MDPGVPSGLPMRQPSPWLLSLLAGLLALWFGGCGGESSGHANDSGVTCVDDNECPAGQVCVANVCQPPADASVDSGPPPEPAIRVQPTSLDFGFAPLRIDTILPLEIHNDGQADLEVTAILVEEVDHLQEYHAQPEGVLDPALVIPPGDSHTVNVVLRPEDAELDTGQLRINSNDPESPSLTVPLTASYKGTPDIEGCALDAAAPDPTPFVDCVVDDVDQEPMVDFGVVTFQQDASRIVVVRNRTEGNAPLEITDVSVTNTSGLGGHFRVETYFLETGPGGDRTEIPVTAPLSLRPADPQAGVQEEQLYIRLWFDGDLDGLLPEEHLLVANNGASGDLSIPIFGVVSGCPANTWDLNGDPNDGCEYACTYVGPETCDGADDNCNGEVDEPDALGCTVYYRDVDSDTYGQTGDSRCLCSPDPQGHYTATQAGDCDDSLNVIHPGMVEQCATPADDNCDGDTNDQDAYGCTLYYADLDNDGFGVTTDARCYCQPQGVYRATQGGDCDDANPNANPSRVEDCATAYDDNCNGNTNDEDAQGCLDYYVDLDNDTYGQTFLSRCLCTAEGNYRALLPADCNDNNPQVHPGQTEDCNTSYDDNCDGDTNEVNASHCTTYYQDADNDTYGVSSDTQCRCGPLGNYRATVGGDCDDQNASVHPSAPETCATPYDDNCNGDTNDLGATGCTTYYRDDDADGFGLAGSSECRCVSAGAFTATVSGDCNDADSAVNPSATERCGTPYDDNCNGQTNELNADGCTTYFMDADGDGYGNGSVGVECRCGPSGLYRATQPGDCNDSQAAINPGAVELCDLVDNNCIAGVDEGFNLLTDPNHCGGCNHQCTNAHGTTACAAGICTPTCAAGWGDCNGQPDDGCETDLTTVTQCGNCTQDAECPPGFYCGSGGTCDRKETNGTPCSRDAACQSDHCVDGVCCDSACDGTCEACDLSGSEGTCTPHPAGVDPENECTGTAASTCGLNGQCDGSGACAQWPAGTECAAQSCSGTTQHNADTCDGSGTCADGGTVDCTPYACGTTACRTTCSTDSHCADGYFCSGGACVGKKANGATCGSTSECQSGNCVDGVCCDTPCLGLCRSCAITGSVGTCSNLPTGTDPDNECGLCRTCNGAGQCVNAPDGADPKNDCTATPASTCGDDGACNGSGGCRDWALGTECVPQSCTGSTKHLADTCNGAGACLDGGQVACDPYLCDAAGLDCRTSCTSNADCVATSFCSGGVCVGKKGNGQSCGGDAECQSGHCADGVCCNTACAGTCQSCNLAGSVGSCVNIPANQDPDGECAGTCQSCNGAGACAPTSAGIDPENECAVQPASSCGTDGECNGAGACRQYVAGTECAPQTCSGSTRYPADTCDGSGTCTDAGQVSCSPYVCNAAGTDCRSDCGDDSHCVSGYYCAGGLCLAKKPNGQTCGGAGECQSGFCVDGVCCNSTCAGPCRACNVSGSEGTCVNHASGTDPENGCGTCTVCDGAGACTPAPNNTDPKNDCAQDPQASCGQDGLCDGAGACGYWAPTTVCNAAYCVDGHTAALADQCDGSGQCVDAGSQDCSPYVCSGGACRTSCTQDSDCVSGSYCNAGVCAPKLPAGQACGSANQCQSGFCADGVCCNEACTGLCRACNQAGSVGTCTPYANGSDPEDECGLCQTCNGGGACTFAVDGTDPKDDCAATASDSCGPDGQCNGAGGCRFWAAGTECAPQTCSGETLYPPDTCNGAGTCADGGTQSCAPYACDAAGTACRSACSQQSHCAAGFYCNGSGVCVAQKSNGLSCGSGAECQSGFCVDGVCCNSACNGTCQACNLSGSVGACTPHAAQTDPEGECPLCRVCNGAGACTTATDGTDPKAECAASAQSSCGLDGACNGAGACGYWPSGTVCAPQTCTNHVKHLADTCDGAGTCADGGTVDCTPYECSGNDCATSCTSDLQCVAGYYCAGGACVAKRANGQTCTAANQCLSGFCADGVCCNSACNGTCQACNVSGHVGTCWNHAANTDPEAECGLCRTCNGAGACANVAAGSDPLNQCATQSQSSCGQDGACDGSGACRLWAAGTECAAVQCVGATLLQADTCNGSGTCVDGGTTDCSPYVCNATGTGCRTSCTSNSHCVSGYYCNGANQCVPENPAGTPCTLDAECASGFCRDGYCCNNDCSGACRACNKPGSEGTCTNHAANTDPESECGTCRVCNGSGACVNAADGTDPLNQCAADPQSSCGLDGACNGAGACGYYEFGTVCVAQSCTGSTKYVADTCNGSGTCVDGGTVSCAPYKCAGNDCATSCATDSDCVSGYYCSGGLCLPKKGLGNSCGAANECTSGFCADGVCCNSACTGTCRACDIAGSIGTCSNYGANLDPEDECGTCRVCNGSGACMDAAAGSDPKNECDAESQSSCGQNGTCDGAGACDYWDGSTVCAAQICSNHVKYFTDYCGGPYSCADSGSQDCSPYQCVGNDCGTSCAADGDCVAGYYCVSPNCCAPSSTEAGPSCGSGTPHTWTNNNTSPPGATFTGNLVPTTAERWYKFTAREDASGNLRVWAWLSSNPGDEFRIEVRLSDDSITSCGSGTSSAGCTGAATRYSFVVADDGRPHSSPDIDDKTFYIRVYRRSGATPTCAQYQLRVRVGGAQPY